MCTPEQSGLFDSLAEEPALVGGEGFSVVFAGAGLGGQFGCCCLRFLIGALLIRRDIFT
jgi:hypothetical protein